MRRLRTPARLGLTVLEDRTVPATRTWTGAVDANWTTAGNWDAAVAAGDDLVFPAGAAGLAAVNDFAAGTTFGSIAVQAAGYDLSGNALALTGGLTASLTAGAADYRIDTALGTGAVSVASGGSLAVSGALSGAAGLTLSGGGTLTFAGAAANTYTGSTFVNAGTLVLAKTGGAAAVPSGALFVGNDSGSGDAVQLAAPDQIADGVDITVRSDGTLNLAGFDDAIGGLTLTGSTVATGAGTLTLGGNVTTNAASVTAVISGRLDLGGATRTFFVADGSAGTDLSVSAAISGTGAGLVKGGSASFMQLSGNNTYDGPTTVSTGGLGAAHPNALGTTTAGTTVANGATLAFQGGNTFAAEPMTVTGNGVGNLGALWSSSGTNTVTGLITLAGNSFIGAESAAPLTVVGQITDGAGTFGLTKVRSGTLTLTNANPYNGGTTVSGGVVRASNDGALGTAAASVASGAALGLSGGVTLANPVTASGTGVGGTGAVRAVVGANTLSGGLTLGADGTAVGVDAGASLTVATTGIGGAATTHGLTKVGGGSLALAAGPAGGWAGPVTASAGALLVEAGYAGSSVNLTGGTLGGSGTVGAVTAGGTVAPGSSAGILSTGDLNLTAGATYAPALDGPTAGVGHDQLSVTGTVTLTNPTLSITLGYGPNLGHSFTVIDNDGSDAVSGTFAGLAEGATVMVGPVTLQVSYVGGTGNDVVLTVVGVTSTWDGGGGDDNWSTAANWVGDVAPGAGASLLFPAGAARLASVNDLTAGTHFANLTVADAGYAISGNALVVDGQVVATYAAGGSALALPVGLQLGLVDVAAGGTLTLGGAVSGGAGLVLGGGGTLRLTGSAANTYTGTTQVDAGTLVLGKTAGTAAVPGPLVVGDGSGADAVVLEASDQIADAAAVTVSEGATLDLDGFSDAIGSLTLTGSTVQTGAGTLTLGGNVVTNASSTTAVVSGHLNLGGATRTFAVADGSAGTDLTVSAVISGTGAGLIKTGANSHLLLSGNNTYDGATTISSGTLIASNAHSLGTTAAGTAVAHAATLRLDGGFTLAAEPLTFSGNGSLLSSGGDNTIVSAFAFPFGNLTVAAASGTTLTLSGVIGGSDAPDVFFGNPTFSGTVVLSGNNTFNNYVDVIAGTLILAHPNALGGTTNGVFLVSSGATLGLQGGITVADPINNLSGSGVGGLGAMRGLGGSNVFTGAIGLAADSSIGVDAGGTLDLGGAISNARALTKVGAGSLALSGTSAYTGSTAVNAGTLLVNGSVAASSGLTTAAAATVGGTGTLPGVNASLGGTVSPGDAGPGALSAGGVALGAGTTLVVDLDGTTAGTQYDRLAVSGTVDLNGAALAVALGFAPAIGDAFTVVTNDGVDPVAGTFAGLAEGAAVTAGGTTFRITYVGGDGNDIVLTAVGVPAVTTATSAGPSVYGQPVTFSATVTGTSGTPTGTASLVIDGVTVETVPLVAGAATFAPVAGLTVGSHTVSVLYSGDVAYVAGSDGLDGDQVVTQAATTAAVGGSPNPSAFGQTVTLTATVAAVAPGAGTPTGTVLFFDGATLVGASALDGAGVATLTTSALPVGSHSITAVYAGDGNYAASTSSANTQTVDRASTVTAVSSNAPAPTYGDAVAFTAVVIPAFGGLATGSVTFYDGAAVLGTAALDGTGTAVLTTSALPAGSRSITAAYAGDATFTPSTSAATGQTVTPAVLTVTAADETRAYGAANPTFTATVTGFVNGESLATSGVTGAPVLATAATPASHVAAGPFAITATAGTLAAANYTFAFVPGQLTVTPAPLTITAADQTKVFGQAVPALTAVYSGLVNGDTPADLDTLPTLATAATAASPVGGSPYAITVGGAADGDYAITFVPGSLAVTPAAVAVAVGPTSAATYSQPVTLTATVAAVAPGAGVPTGTVTFRDGAVVLGTAAVDAGGVATLAVAGLAVGGHPVTAEYAGDGNFAGGTSAPVVQTIDPIATATAVSSSAADAVTHGQPATFTAVVTPAAGGTPTGTVTFRVDGAAVATVALQAGVARFTTAGLAFGTRSVTATYGGDAVFAGSSAGLAQKVRAAGGDVDGDGRPELAAGPASGGNRVTVYRGDGASAVSFDAFPGFTGGVSVALADVDGDGAAEVIAGAGAGGGPEVRVFDGRTGALLRSFLAYEGSFRGGVTVAAGDLDGDGKAEIVAGAGAGGAPRVTVFDGTTLAMIGSFFAFEPSFRGGVNVAVGDLDGDGDQDILAGAGAGGAPRAAVFDGRTYAPAGSSFAFEPSFRGGVHVAAADVTGDGRADLIAGAGTGAGARVRVFDGATGGEVDSFFAFDDFLGGVEVG